MHLKYLKLILDKVSTVFDIWSAFGVFRWSHKKVTVPEEKLFSENSDMINRQKRTSSCKVISEATFDRERILLVDSSDEGLVKT